MSHEVKGRKFKITDAELNIKTIIMRDAAIRDEVELLDMGFTPAKRAIIEAKRVVLYNVKPDTYYMERVVEKRIARDDQDAIVEAAATKMRQRFLNAFPNNEGKQRLAGDAFSQLDSLKLTVAARVLASHAEDNLSALGGVHITIVTIQELRDEVTLLEEAIVLYDKEKGFRSQAAVDRVAAGNDLYDDLTFLAQVGKSVWDGVNTAKYDDYVINPTSGSTTQTKSGTINMGQVLAPDVTISDADVHVLAINESLDSMYQLYFSHYMPDGQLAPPALPPTMIPINSTVNHRAGEYGYDSQNTVLVLEGMGPGNADWVIQVLG
ncbi:MAG: hypothetical protein NTX03_05235 [Bacteroidetes bacterium]|nr:hypothetical protein [Bacteroidota bacterium]